MNHQKFSFHFGKNIHDLRIKRGWTRQELSHHSGLAPALIASIERGHAAVSLKLILQVMEGLGYTDDEGLVTNL